MPFLLAVPLLASRAARRRADRGRPRARGARRRRLLRGDALRAAARALGGGGAALARGVQPGRVLVVVGAAVGAEGLGLGLAVGAFLAGLAAPPRRGATSSSPRCCRCAASCSACSSPPSACCSTSGSPGSTRGWSRCCWPRPRSSRRRWSRARSASCCASARRASVLAALALAQTGEFSFVLPRPRPPRACSTASLAGLRRGVGAEPGRDALPDARRARRCSTGARAARRRRRAPPRPVRPRARDRLRPGRAEPHARAPGDRHSVAGGGREPERPSRRRRRAAGAVVYGDATRPALARAARRPERARRGRGDHRSARHAPHRLARAPPRPRARKLLARTRYVQDVDTLQALGAHTRGGRGARGGDRPADARAARVRARERDGRRLRRGAARRGLRAAPDAARCGARPVARGAAQQVGTEWVDVPADFAPAQTSAASRCAPGRARASSRWSAAASTRRIRPPPFPSGRRPSARVRWQRGDRTRARLARGPGPASANESAGRAR